MNLWSSGNTIRHCQSNFSPLRLFMKDVLENLNSNYSGIDIGRILSVEKSLKK